VYSTLTPNFERWFKSFDSPYIEFSSIPSSSILTPNRDEISRSYPDVLASGSIKKSGSN